MVSRSWLTGGDTVAADSANCETPYHSPGVRCHLLFLSTLFGELTVLEKFCPADYTRSLQISGKRFLLFLFAGFNAADFFVFNLYNAFINNYSLVIIFYGRICLEISFSFSNSNRVKYFGYPGLILGEKNIFL